MDAIRPRVVEWYRSDVWYVGAPMRRILAIGPLVLTTGSLVITGSLVPHPLFHLRTEFALAGLVLVAGGAAYTLASMYRILREDLSLVIRSDGVVVQMHRLATLIEWDDLRIARWEAPVGGVRAVEKGALVLERSSGPPLVVQGRFARIGGPQLAARIMEVKRKITMRLKI
jgi:hypothetical protein